MKRFLVYCSVGSGGMFLISVLAKILGYDVCPVISSRGHVHQLSKNGIWNNTQDINFIGEFWCNFSADKKLFYTHVLDIDQFKRKYSDVQLILINFESSDVKLIARLFVNKAWPDIWSKEEYDRWAGPSWPPYNSNNILESELIRDEIIEDLSRTRIQPWIDSVNNSDFDYMIDFKTIMGLSNTQLSAQLTNILNQPVTDEVNQYIQQYQQINQQLYINE